MISPFSTRNSLAVCYYVWLCSLDLSHVTVRIIAKEKPNTTCCHPFSFLCLQKWQMMRHEKVISCYYPKCSAGTRLLLFYWREQSRTMWTDSPKTKPQPLRCISGLIWMALSVPDREGFHIICSFSCSYFYLCVDEKSFMFFNAQIFYFFLWPYCT